ncbi:MAG: ATP-binding cassette subfamily B protein [Myxococcota bacterium]|jgi:ATP-binding cassette subfamily B protein
MNAQATSDSPLRRLYHYATPHRRTVHWAIFCSILNKLFDLAPPLLIGAAVDIVVKREDSVLAGMGIENTHTQLWVLAGVTFLVWLLESVFEYLEKLAWRNLAQTMQHDLRLDAYDHVQRLSMRFLERQRTGGLMAVLNDDVNQLERFLDVGANDILQVATSTLTIGVVFFLLAPEVAWLAMLPMPFVLWGSVAFQKRIAPRYSVVREASALVNSQLSSNLSGVTTIKSFTAEDRETSRIRALSQDYRTANGDAIRLSSAFSPLIRMVIVIGFTATLVMGGLQTLAGELGVGSYSILVFMTQRLLWPLTRLGATFDLFQRAMASTRRVMDLLDTPVVEKSGSRPLPSDQVVGKVAFEDVHFAYTPGHPVFDGLSFAIEPDTTVAFVGTTGAGKSTIIKLILRMYEPDGGQITLDGTPLAELDLTDLRSAIGMVSQDVYLFHGTVLENIAYGRPDASRDDIVAAAAVAEAHDFIAGLPGGYDTVVGERGQRLSGGQRQRISLARAILKDPPILVLDEATSAVDNETEAAIQRSLERIAKGRVTVLIAHRLSTVRNAHQIHVLDAGQIVESGDHGGLLSQNGTYAALWRVQTGERPAQ